MTADLDISEGISPDVIQKYKRLSAEVSLAGSWITSCDPGLTGGSLRKSRKM